MYVAPSMPPAFAVGTAFCQKTAWKKPLRGFSVLVGQILNGMAKL
jgi:hypothetical protein